MIDFKCEWATHKLMGPLKTVELDDNTLIILDFLRQAFEFNFKMTLKELFQYTEFETEDSFQNSLLIIDEKLNECGSKFKLRCKDDLIFIYLLKSS